MKYSLQKYRHGTKHKCPQCKRERCFVLYVDKNDNPLHETVGRCDHENSCGYHYTPRQFFADNPNLRITDNLCESQPKPHFTTQPTCSIPLELVNKSFSPRNRFVVFLFNILGNYGLDITTISKVIEEYCIGSTKDGRTIFFQIDKDFKVRTGKIISYDAESGRRDKKAGIDWVHSIMKRKRQLPDNWQLNQCLFGEHLLNKYPNKTVALVEAEKTAIICAAVYPEYVWLSVGSVQNLSAKAGSKGLQMLKALTNRKVIIIPDVDGFQRWAEASKLLTFCKCIVSDYIEKNATIEDRKNKIDIADILIREFKNLDKSR